MENDKQKGKDFSFAQMWDRAAGDVQLPPGLPPELSAGIKAIYFLGMVDAAGVLKNGHAGLPPLEFIHMIEKMEADAAIEVKKGADAVRKARVERGDL